MHRRTVQLCVFPRCGSLPSFFGLFAGGLCETHAVEVAQEYGFDPFFTDYHDDLRHAIERDKRLTKMGRPTPQFRGTGYGSDSASGIVAAEGGRDAQRLDERSEQSPAPEGGDAQP